MHNKVLKRLTYKHNFFNHLTYKDILTLSQNLLVGVGIVSSSELKEDNVIVGKILEKFMLGSKLFQTVSKVFTSSSHVGASVCGCVCGCVCLWVF